MIMRMSAWWREPIVFRVTGDSSNRVYCLCYPLVLHVSAFDGYLLSAMAPGWDTDCHDVSVPADVAAYLDALP